jgi:uncharacterized membrane protein YeaQ/YmgE (transglycosylase-associated protein family)
VSSQAFGGNIAGSLLKNSSLGTLGNSIVGIVGGGHGGQLLGLLGVGAAGGGGLDIGTFNGLIDIRQRQTINRQIERR